MTSETKRLFLFLFIALTLAGCDGFSSEPTYSGISVEGMNYTPFNLTRFVIHDKYGNRAGGGGDLMPGDTVLGNRVDDLAGHRIDIGEAPVRLIGDQEG